MSKLTNKSYRKALKRLLNTEDGKEVLAYLNLIHVKGSAFSNTVEETYAKLAIKEFVQALTNDVNDPREIDDIINKSREQEYNYDNR